MWFASHWWSRGLVYVGYGAVAGGFCSWAGRQSYPYLWGLLGLATAIGLYMGWWTWVGWGLEHGAYPWVLDGDAQMIDANSYGSGSHGGHGSTGE
jgi:hypothetical protein